MSLELPFKLLIGPLFDPGFLGQYLGSPSIRAFMYDPPESSLTEPLSWDTRLFSQVISLEAGQLGSWLEEQLRSWQPDVLLWLAPSHLGIPAEVLRLRLFKAVLSHDWALNPSAISLCLQQFDLVLAERRLLQQLEAQGYSRAVYAPSYGFDPQRFHLLPDSERQVDISFVGSISAMHIPERNQYIRRLYELGERYRVVVRQGIYGRDYTRLLNQSKLVFNLSQRGEMNLRAYEAPACGALLLIEESNLEIQDYLKPGQECVLYNAHNFEERVDYYLRHDALRLKMARAGYQAIQQHSYQRQFERLIPLLARHAAQQDSQRQQAYCSDPLREAHSWLLTRLPNRFGLAHQILQTASFQQTEPQAAAWIQHALGVLNQYVLIFQERTLFSRNYAGSQRRLLDSACEQLQPALKLWPEHPVPHYHLGWYYLLTEQTDQALACFAKVFQLLPRARISLSDPLFLFLLPLYLYDYAAGNLQVQLGHSWLQKAEASVIQSWLPWVMLQIVGDYFFVKGQPRQALVFLEQAKELQPQIFQTWWLLGQIYLKLNQPQQAERALSQALELQPHSPLIWLQWLQQLISSGQHARARQMMQKYRQIETIMARREPNTALSFQLLELRCAGLPSHQQILNGGADAT